MEKSNNDSPPLIHRVVKVTGTYAVPSALDIERFHDTSEWHRKDVQLYNSALENSEKVGMIKMMSTREVLKALRKDKWPYECVNCQKYYSTVLMLESTITQLEEQLDRARMQLNVKWNPIKFYPDDGSSFSV